MSAAKRAWQAASSSTGVHGNLAPPLRQRPRAPLRQWGHLTAHHNTQLIPTTKPGRTFWTNTWNWNWLFREPKIAVTFTVLLPRFCRPTTAVQTSPMGNTAASVKYNTFTTVHKRKAAPKASPSRTRTVVRDHDNRCSTGSSTSARRPPVSTPTTST